MSFHSFNLDSENVSQSEYSPGTVKDDELLGRLAYAPKEILNGKLVPEAISSNDLKKRGFSLFRDDFCNQDEITLLAITQMGKKPEDRKNAFISFFKTSKVREQIIEYANEDGDKLKARSFLVIDEALEEVKSHATIYNSQKFGRATIKELKNQLIEIINEFVEVDVTKTEKNATQS